MNVGAINEELLLFCENVFEKYKLFKKKSSEENKNLFFKLETVLQENDEISIERDSLKSQLDLALNKNKILKNKNDYENVLKKNEALSSKLGFILKELDLVSKKNSSLKNDFDTHVCHVLSASSSIDKHVGCSTLSSCIKNDICMLKKSVDCLGSTLSQCAWITRN